MTLPRTNFWQQASDAHNPPHRDPAPVSVTVTGLERDALDYEGRA